VPTVRDTVAEMVQYVFPQYAGATLSFHLERCDWEAAEKRQAARGERVRELRATLATEAAW